MAFKMKAELKVNGDGQYEIHVKDFMGDERVFVLTRRETREKADAALAALEATK